MHNLTEPQWTDRFLNHLSKLCTVTITDATAWAADTYPGTDAEPEAVAKEVASALAEAEQIAARDAQASPSREVLRIDSDTFLTPEARARGVGAAQVVFEQAGISSTRAANASFRREGWDMRGFPRWLTPTAEQHRAADVWLAACASARAVSGGGDLCLETEPLEPGGCALIRS